MIERRGFTNHVASRVFLFLGAPGSGKGTQSSWLSSRLNIPALSTGEILRSEAGQNTPASFQLRQTLASGALVHDDLVCALVGARLRRDMPRRGLILDGFPRTVRQARFLDSLLADLGLPKPRVLHLHVSADALLKRLTARRQCARCGSIYNLISRPSLRGRRCEIDGGVLIQRDDDTEGVILRRLAEYEKSSAPLVDYYAQGDYYLIDGDRNPEDVLNRVLEIAIPGEVLVGACGD